MNRSNRTIKMKKVKEKDYENYSEHGKSEAMK